jgi:hypothetical protein
MSRGLPIPFFPTPPRDYSQSYFSQLVRNFSVFAQQTQVPGPLQATQLTLTDLPTDDVDLVLGAVFHHGGVLRISLLNAPHVRGSAATGQVGSVVVVTA